METEGDDTNVNNFEQMTNPNPNLPIKDNTSPISFDSVQPNSIIFKNGANNSPYWNNQ